MKNLLITLTLIASAACVSPGPGLVPVDADGPVARTIERVLERVEVYMESEVSPGADIPQESRGPIAAAIATARVMTMSGSASGDMLLVTMSGVMNLHDALIMQDFQLGNLEQLEVEVYLEDTARLRSLFSAVSIHEPASLPVN